MISVFWEHQCVIVIDFLEKGSKTITGKYHAFLLDHLKNKLLKETDHIYPKKKVLFHQDNAYVHTCVIALSK